jgi:hypothetical protein
MFFKILKLILRARQGCFLLFKILYKTFGKEKHFYIPERKGIDCIINMQLVITIQTKSVRNTI